MAGGVLLLLGFVLVLVPILYQQAELFAARTPEYLAWVDGKALPWLQERLAAWTGSTDWTALLRERINQNMGQLAGFLQTVLGKLTKGGAAVVTFLANLVVMFAVFGYMLADWDNLMARLAALVPDMLQELLDKRFHLTTRIRILGCHLWSNPNPPAISHRVRPGRGEHSPGISL